MKTATKRRRSPERGGEIHQMIPNEDATTTSAAACISIGGESSTLTIQNTHLHTHHHHHHNNNNLPQLPYNADLAHLMDAHGLVYDDTTLTIRCTLCTAEGTAVPYMVMAGVGGIGGDKDDEDCGVSESSAISSSSGLVGSGAPQASPSSLHDHVLQMLMEHTRTTTASSATPVEAKKTSASLQKTTVTTTSNHSSSPTHIRQQLLTHINSVRHLSALEQWQGVDDSHAFVEINNQRMLLSHAIVFPDTMFGRGTTLFDLTMQLLLLPNEIGAIQLFANHRYFVAELQLPSSDSRPPSDVAPPILRKQRRERPRESDTRKTTIVRSDGLPSPAILQQQQQQNSISGGGAEVIDPLPMGVKCTYREDELADPYSALSAPTSNRHYAPDGGARYTAANPLVFLHASGTGTGGGGGDGAMGMDGAGGADGGDGIHRTIQYGGLHPTEAQQRLEGVNVRIAVEKCRKAS